jgi:tRNA(Ile)-lysidine synthase
VAFQPQDLLRWLPEKATTCHVAFSGGIDSLVLLHALARLRDSGELRCELHAIHVHHGLSPHADAWAVHCQDVCAGLGVSLQVVRVRVSESGHGPEQAAREARYRAFGDILGKGHVLLTAHHQDDQVETQLFRMLRGTGMRGLAGIRSQRPFADGMLLRPLLGYSRGMLMAYAEEQGLQWIEDESNTDESLDRNYLRRLIVPALGERWPGFQKNLQRLAKLAEEGQALAEEVGADDLAQAMDGMHRIDISRLLAFSPVRQRNLLRYWFLALETKYGIPAPDHYVIDRIFSELIPAAVDAEPMIEWNKSGQHVVIRRFAERIYLVLDAAAPDPAPTMWTVQQPLELPGLGTLLMVETTEDGFLAPPDGTLEVRFRQGGETAKPAGRKTRPLKKILQDYQVPPWLREKIPLFYRDGELLAVGDLFVTDHWHVRNQDAQGKKIHQIRWLREDLHCGY